MKPDAGPDELTVPDEYQLRRNGGMCKRCKAYIGGVALSYIERCESGIDFELNEMLLLRLEKATTKAWWMRFNWYVWMAFGWWAMFLPWTAEMASIPIIGGCLIRWESQSAAMFVFADCITFVSYCIVSGALWARVKPTLTLILACTCCATIVMIFKLGESIPTYYAKYLLGYF